jgi:hypothetical protein
MNRLRKLCVTAVMALSVTALFGAGTAMASGFEADSYPATFTGVTEGDFRLTGQSYATTCYSQKWSGSAEWTSETLDGDSASDSTCIEIGEYPLRMNGCTFSYHPGAETAPGKFDGTFDIGPGGCGPIVLKTSRCELSIGAQTGLAATFTNVGSGSSSSVRIEANATNLKLTQKKLVGSGCTNATIENGKWQAAWVVTGEDANNQAIGVRVVDQVPVAIGIEGSPPQFVTEKYPASLSGEQGAPYEHVFGTSAGQSSCENAQFDSEISAPTTSLPFSAQYSVCTVTGFAGGTVAMNGCTYGLNVSNAGTPYVGTVDIVCPAGKAIELTSKLFTVKKCTTTIGSQSGLAGVAYQSGFGGAIGVTLDLEGIAYHQQAGTGIAACTTGDFTNGTYTGDFDVYAFH